MLDSWLTREAMIALAVFGGIASMLSATLQSASKVNARCARCITWAGYGFMAASVLLFIVLGLRAPAR